MYVCVYASRCEEERCEEEEEEEEEEEKEEVGSKSKTRTHTWKVVGKRSPCFCLRSPGPCSLK